MRKAATVSVMIVVILLGISLGRARGYLAQEGASEDMTNDRVIQLTKMGLDDDIIIAKIKTGHTKFALGDEDLVALKKAGVSGKVIAAMLESNVLTVARVKVDGNTVELHTLGEAKTGGRLGSKVTFGIKSVKQKAYLQGQHAAVISSTKPKIEVELPPNDTIDSYILVKMNGKGDRRELEVGSLGAAVGAKEGVRAEDVVKTSAESLGGRRYMITTQNPLKGHEYILYVVGSADFTKGIYGKGYDFTVE